MTTKKTYTDRQPIPLESRIVTTEEIHIATSSTNYCRLFKEPKHDLKALLKLHTEVAREAKRLGISVSYRTKIKSRLDEHIRTRSYERAYQEYDAAFLELKSLWERKLEEGLYMGTSDDVMLKEQIVPLQWRIDAMFNRSQVLFEIREMKRTLEKLEYELEHSAHGLVRIYL